MKKSCLEIDCLIKNLTNKYAVSLPIKIVKNEFNRQTYSILINLSWERKDTICEFINQQIFSSF